MRDSTAHRLCEVEFGLSVYQPVKNRWAIIYDDALPPDEYRWSVAHELGHIFLGHEYKCYDGLLSFGKVSDRLEADADSFALRLLAPACVLWAFDLHSADEIAKVCGIPVRFAVKRAARMQELYKRSKFLTSLAEKKVFYNFRNWIEMSKKP